MSSPHPTVQEQIEAVAFLRDFAVSVPRYVNPTAAELGVVEAVNALDNADLFAALDEVSDDQEDRLP